MAKQVRQLSTELEQAVRAMKAEEERTQTAEFEIRKQAAEWAALKQRMDGQMEEAEAEMAAERWMNSSLGNMDIFVENGTQRNWMR